MLVRSDITEIPKRLHGIVPAKKVSASKANPSEELSVSPEGVDLNGVIDDIERKLIVQALQLSKGVKSKAASLLGLNRTTLVEKMKKKGIEVASKN